MSEMIMPCPFCGGPGIIERRQRDIGGGDFRTVYVATCGSECVVRPRVAIDGESGYGHHDTRNNTEARDVAVRYWNMRDGVGR